MKNDILQDNWLAYLRWWNEDVKDESKPPTEERFWVWYCQAIIDKK